MDRQAGATTLVEKIVSEIAGRIEAGRLRTGERLLSVRAAANEYGVSRFTVVQAYDRLVSRALIESRPGAGYFVRARLFASARPGVNAWADAQTPGVDIVWLLRNMFKRLPADKMPGAGVLPADWLDADLISQSLRAVGRQSGAALLDYGHPQGYLPLREQLVQRLERLNIGVSPEGLLCTVGVTQGLDLVIQRFLTPGDTVLVEAPSWFVMFGQLAERGLQVVGLPRLADGPCLASLERLAMRHRPKMVFVSGVLHNPTGTSMSVQRVHEILRLAERYDMIIVEDDVNADFYPDEQLVSGLRLAAADGLRRVIYLGGFSKTLAANLRVGFVATSIDRVRELTDLKMLRGLTSPELGERVVYQILSQGHYRRHLHRLHRRLDDARGPVIEALEALGMEIFASPVGGMFVYARSSRSSNEVAARMLDAGYLMAPGSLFMPDQGDVAWMRFNISTSLNTAMLAELRSAINELP